TRAAPFLHRFHRLGVEDSDGGFGLLALFEAMGLAQSSQDPIPGAIAASASIPGVYLRPCAVFLGQVSPLAAGAQHVQDAVDLPAHVAFVRTARTRWFIGNQGLDQGPLLGSQIAWVHPCPSSLLRMRGR